jgi:hypothetical protein
VERKNFKNCFQYDVVLVMQNFTHFSCILPTLFPGIEELCSNEDEWKSHSDIGDEKLLAISGDYFAVILNTLLIFGRFPTVQNDFSDLEILSEVEFEDKLNFVTWDTDGNCVAVSDVKGHIHLVKVDGTVMLSKPLSSGTKMYINALCFNNSSTYRYWSTCNWNAVHIVRKLTDIYCCVVRCSTVHDEQFIAQ